MRLTALIKPEAILSSKVEGDPEISGVVQSSSAVVPESLFVAVAGTKVDGHSFVAEALAKGASAILVEREEVFRSVEKAVLVRSTRLQLGLASARWNGSPTERFRLVGVTGTNGKTTTTFLLRQAWESERIRSGLVGTVQYLIGDEALESNLTTPDAPALQALFRKMADRGVTRAAMEVSSIALHQHRAAGSRFHTAVFTNLTQDHLDYHGTMEDYFRAKCVLFDEYRPAVSVINVDDPWGRRLCEVAKESRVVRFSLEDPSAEYFVSQPSYGWSETRARVRTPDGDCELRLGLVGRHNLYNALGALAALRGTGMPLDKAVAALAAAPGAPGRLERVLQGREFPNVFVDYAHSDDALRNLLGAVRDLRGSGGRGRIVTVFGCGGDRDKTKRPKMARVASTMSDVTIATSDNPRTESPDAIVDDIENGIERGATEYHRVVNRRDAIRLALSLARPEDIVVIAGKGHENYQILGTRKVAFDDRLVVREYYSQ